MVFPSKRLARKFVRIIGSDDSATTTTIMVPSKKFGIIYKLDVSVDVQNESDLENLKAISTISCVIGATVWSVHVHPLIEHTSGTPQNFRTVDLGPWKFEWGDAGFYSGVAGEDVVVTVGAMGTNIKSRFCLAYHGD